ncbi:MAG: hypothetical protein RL069_2784, partial [Planctomycetota bacterium]
EKLAESRLVFDKLFGGKIPINGLFFGRNWVKVFVHIRSVVGRGLRCWFNEC